MTLREGGIFVDGPTLVDGSDVLDADAAGEGLGRDRGKTSRGGLEQGGDFRGSDDPVGFAAEGLTVDDGGNFDELDEQRLVAFFDRVTEGGVVIPSRNRTGVIAEVTEDFAVDFEVDFLGENVGQFGFGVQVVLGAEVLLNFIRPGGFDLTGLDADLFVLDDEVHFRQILVALHVVLVGEYDVVRAGGAAPGQGQFAGAVVQRGAGDGVRRAADGGEGEGAGLRDDKVLNRGDADNDGAGDGAREDRGVLKGREDGQGVATGVGRGRLVLHDLAAVIRRQVHIARSQLLEAVDVIAGIPAIVRGATDGTLVGRVAETHVIDESGRSEQRLDGDDLVGDKLREDTTDEGDGDALELSNVTTVGAEFVEQHLVFHHDGGHGAKAGIRNAFEETVLLPVGFCLDSFIQIIRINHKIKLFLLKLG